jgi:predicted aconitase/predicted aconitase with swiveling domain
VQRLIVSAPADGEIIVCTEGLSFWGGVDANTGVVIDAHHPQHGQSLAGKIVMMPTSRGSCSGSGVLLELAMNGNAPAALVFHQKEDVLTLGALIATRMFECPVAVVQLSVADYNLLATKTSAHLNSNQLVAEDLSLSLDGVSVDDLELTELDARQLDGEQGPAVKLAIETLCTMACVQGAKRLTDVTRAHIDGCIYAGPANLVFAQKMAAMGAKVRIPTTMNAISVDHENWQSQGVPPDFGLAASQLANAYVQMGAKPSFTCAPYQAEDAPIQGEDIGWSESNAVIYANSVLGARSEKHPDFLDLFIAITGRAPLSGVYLSENRVARMVIDVELPTTHDDALWPMLGWLSGQVASDCIPLLVGLENTSPTADDLRALCAAFGTTSAAPMLHVAGVTPEGNRAPAKDAKRVFLSSADFVRAWKEFNSGPPKIDLVALGSPHFSLAETREFASLMKGRHSHSGTSVVITLGRETKATAQTEGLVAQLEEAGVRIIPDLCWCSISEPVFPPDAKTLMTNSGKYAHYAPGLSGRQVRFGGLEDCANAAETGFARDVMPEWLSGV